MAASFPPPGASTPSSTDRVRATTTTPLETPTPNVARMPISVNGDEKPTMREASGIDMCDAARTGRRASCGNQDAEDEELARMAADAGRRRSSSESKMGQVDAPRIPPSFTFPPDPRPAQTEPPPHEPAPAFSFGTFRMNSPAPMLGTPTTELTPFFEYPLDPVSPAIRRLVADEPPALLAPQGFIPGLRRTSSTSTVPVSPAGGRRPSVVHSNTASQAEAARRFSLAAADSEEATSTTSTTSSAAEARPSASSPIAAPTRRTSDTPLAAPRLATTASPFPARRPSILGFAHQQLPDAPVPPSLAGRVGPNARRGSITAQQLIPLGIPSRDRRQSSISSGISSFRNAPRASLSGPPVVTNQGTQDEHMTVSTAYLYQRRASLASTSRGLLASNAPPSARPSVNPNALHTHRQDSVSSIGSSSRESIATVRDTRAGSPERDKDDRPGYARRGSSEESCATVRRMSMPALASPEAAAARAWCAQGALRMSLGGEAGRAFERPFELGSVPRARGQAGEVFVRETETGSPRQESSGAGTTDRFARSSHAISSSSEELSDTTSDPPSASDQSSSASSANPTRRSFRLSQRAIEARKRRRSSRLSTISATGGGMTLQTIPSEAVVDFAEARSGSGSGSGSARSSVSTGGRQEMDVSVASGSDDESLGGGEKELGGETPTEVITTAFRAFAFPPRR